MRPVLKNPASPPPPEKSPVQKPRKQPRTCPGSGRYKLRISLANTREYADGKVVISTDL